MKRIKKLLAPTLTAYLGMMSVTTLADDAQEVNAVRTTQIFIGDKRCIQTPDSESEFLCMGESDMDWFVVQKTNLPVRKIHRGKGKNLY